MKDYVEVFNDDRDSHIIISFQNETEKTIAIGDKLYKINKKAYMNGYNWDAFFNYYLGQHRTKKPGGGKAGIVVK